MKLKLTRSSGAGPSHIALTKVRGVLKTSWQWLLNDDKIPRVPNDCLIMAQSWQVFQYLHKNLLRWVSTDLLGSVFARFLLSFYCEMHLIWCYVKSCFNWITWKKQGPIYPIKKALVRAAKSCPCQIDPYMYEQSSDAFSSFNNKNCEFYGLRRVKDGKKWKNI